MTSTAMRRPLHAAPPLFLLRSTLPVTAARQNRR